MRLIVIFVVGAIVIDAGCGSSFSLEVPQKTPATSPERSNSSPPLEITMIDVGQGDSILVRSPAGKTLLIDGGAPGAGSKSVLPALRAKGISEIDWTVITHHDLDHEGGILEVLAGEDQIQGTEDDVKTTLYPREAIPAGLTLDMGSGVEAECLAANGRFVDGTRIHLNPDEENEASVALIIRYGEFEFLAAGDLPGGGAPGGFESKNLESRLGELAGPVEVLKASHHGSDSSTQNDLLGLIQPQAALISAGRDNDYGHPHPDVIRRLKDHGADIYRTDEEGNIRLTSWDGVHFSIQGDEYEAR